MIPEALHVHQRPNLNGARMVLGFGGWMDGGDVSLETVSQLIQETRAVAIADIEPSDFFLYSFPGTMEIAAMFRPHVCIEEGLVTHHSGPESRFFCCESANLLLFRGKEPNLRWPAFADCIFSMAEEFDVREMYFVGSVSGAIPHTKDTHFFTSVSVEHMMPRMLEQGAEPSHYEGPGSFVTYLMVRAREQGIPMASLVAEIPAYVQGRNHKCIESAARKLDSLLQLGLDFSELRSMSAAFEDRLRRIVRGRPELNDLIHKMEQEYDKEHRNQHMDELRNWFERQDLRLD